MKRDETELLTLKISAGELALLVSLASDQLFRREFIDPKMPGHRPNGAEVSTGKELVSRLRAILNPNAAKRVLPVRNGRAAASAV